MIDATMSSASGLLPAGGERLSLVLTITVRFLSRKFLGAVALSLTATLEKDWVQVESSRNVRCMNGKGWRHRMTPEGVDSREIYA